eukprot:scaffold6480_cov70-Phaeocystis_antarctica.AAC.2
MNEQLVGRGQGVCALPIVERGAYGAGGVVRRKEGGGGRSRRTQRAGDGSTAAWGQGTGRSARRTCRPCS